MSTIYVPASVWDGLDPVEWAAVCDKVSIPVRLGDPARVHGMFDTEGVFTSDDNGPEWCLWDDHRLTDDHAIAIAAILEE